MSSSGVSFGGALALLFNNVCGPGVVALAPAFSDGGVTAASALLGCSALASLLAAALLCEALASLPRNADLAGRRELADACAPPAFESCGVGVRRTEGTSSL